ncbi:proteophosphoglycan ppg4 [Strigomonas culicis]|uniref:Proteophosphoglycan ppg4 n=1 Tax=Strigomonas culicis TaxID=28005 RepID=S9TGG9_9TRYP|nr:proteophosphoglycan ppg4 [Strigomonas culicis]|eukprot:EPY16019.1 proteophosphoglycan ppg4 [Strigomonas culicis]
MDPSFLDDLPEDRSSSRHPPASTLDATKMFDSRIIYSPPPKESNRRPSGNSGEMGGEHKPFHVGARAVHFDDAAPSRPPAGDETNRSLFPSAVNTASSNTHNSSASAFPFYNISDSTHANNNNNPSNSTYLFPTTTASPPPSAFANPNAGLPAAPVAAPWEAAVSSQRTPYPDAALRTGGSSSSPATEAGSGGDSTLRQRRPPAYSDERRAQDEDEAPVTSFLARYVHERQGRVRNERYYTTVGQYSDLSAARSDDVRRGGGNPYAYVAASEGRYQLASSGSRQALPGLPQATFHSRHPPLFTRAEGVRPGFCQQLLCRLLPQYVETRSPSSRGSWPLSASRGSARCSRCRSGKVRSGRRRCSCGSSAGGGRRERGSGARGIRRDALGTSFGT